MPISNAWRPLRLLRPALFLLALGASAALLAPQQTHAAAALLKPPNNLGLVGYWSFDEGTSTVATDFSGNGNTGTLNNGPLWVSGKRGKALSFNGTNTYVERSDNSSLDMSSNVTVAAWVKLTTLAGGGGHEGHTIVTKREDPCCSANYQLFVGDLSGPFCQGKMASWNGDDAVCGNTSLSAGRWYHMVIVHTPSQVTFYLDGTSDGTQSQSLGAVNGGPLRIGHHLTDNEYSANGLIDEVRIYNRPLSATEVAKLYQSGAVKLNASSRTLQNGSTLANGLVGHWTFDGADMTRGGNFGEASILSDDDSGNGDLLIAQRASLLETATIQSLSFYVTTAAGNLRLGIYDATGPGGGPGTKMAETNGITPAPGWNTANVTSPVSIPAGTYWLAYLPSDDGLHFRKTDSGNARYYSFVYGVMPTTFSTTPNTTTAHWSFYATINSISALDGSGNGNNGTLINMNRATAPTIGKLGQALSFDGTNDYVNVPISASLESDDGTVSVWVKARDDNFGDILGASASLTTDRYWVLALWFDDDVQEEQVQVFVRDGGVGAQYALSAPATEITDGNWHHVVVAVDSTTHIYFDGVSKSVFVFGTDIGLFTDFAAFDTFRIGSEFIGSTQCCFANGVLDDVRVYNRALAAAEVKQLYRLGAAVIRP